MSGGEEEDRSGSARPSPLDEPTQQMTPTPDRRPDEEDTTFSGPLAPPAQLEPEPISEPEPESEQEEEATVVEPVESEPAPDPEPLVEEEATVVSSVEPEEATRPGGESDPKGAIAPSAALHPMLLERIEPSLGRGERLRLDAAHWHVTIGRAEHNDLRLYTASASREHAVIAGNEAGEWVLTPAEGRSVSIDGDPTEEPVELEVGMNLVFGGDQLRCVTEGLEREEMAAPTSAEGLTEAPVARRSGRTSWIVIGAIAALGLALIAYAWFSG